MTGYQVTDEEIASAEEFLAFTRKSPPAASYAIEHDMLVRIIAWYGSIRANGDGSGHLVVNGEPAK